MLDCIKVNLKDMKFPSFASLKALQSCPHQFLGWHVRPDSSFTFDKQIVLSGQSPLLIWQTVADNGHSLVTAVIPYIL